jgi:hypothetical protein
MCQIPTIPTNLLVYARGSNETTHNPMEKQPSSMKCFITHRQPLQKTIIETKPKRGMKNMEQQPNSRVHHDHQDDHNKKP